MGESAMPLRIRGRLLLFQPNHEVHVMALGIGADIVGRFKPSESLF